MGVQSNVSSRLPLHLETVSGQGFIITWGNCEQRNYLKWKNNKHLNWSGLRRKIRRKPGCRVRSVWLAREAPNPISNLTKKSLLAQYLEPKLGIIGAVFLASAHQRVPGGFHLPSNDVNLIVAIHRAARRNVKKKSGETTRECPPSSRSLLADNNSL